MIVSSIKVALATVSLLSTIASAQVISSFTFNGDPRTADPKGCFSNNQPMVLHSRWEHQSQGNCQRVCYGFKKATMAISAGDCYCGDLLPAKAFQIDNSKCNTPCPGDGSEHCGGLNAYTVLTTGYSLGQVGFLPPDQVTGAAASQFSKTTSSTVSDGSTVVETTVIQGGSEETNSSLPQQTSSGSSDDDSGTNVAGIAAGVVVGIVGIAALIGGVYFFLRRRRRQAEEEEKRQQDIVAGFVDGGRKPGTSHSSMNDSRLDPELVRRQSDGSIADNQDYTRRILQVTNPDGY